MEGQLTIYNEIYPRYKIIKPIKMITLFSGYDSQCLAMKYIGANYECYKTCEWAVKSIQALKDIHFENDNNDYSKDLDIDTIKTYLYNKGISSNYNEPMTLSQINRLKEEQIRTIYNNIQATHNLVNIQQVKGKDLEIIDKDKYEYIMTYSFPCQDLSLAGKHKGMSDTTTRSGMLWEVERILNECKELGQLPQCLLMENVPQVHGKKNYEDWERWLDSLTELGYTNFYQDLIATDYGIPQTRKRTFMVSILGEYSYKFPNPIPLELKLKDMLENNVDEKYFLSNKQIECIKKWNAYEKPLETIDKEISKTLTTRTGAYASGMQLVKDNVVGTFQFAKSDKFMHGKDRFQVGKDTSDTLQTSQKEGIVINDIYSESERKLFTEDGNIKRYMNSDIVDEFKEGQMATTSYPNGYGHGPRTHDNSVALNTVEKPSVKCNYRIRKLTPNECFRLMGVKDEDYIKCAKNQTDTSLYHLAGDSIVVSVLEAIFKNML